MIDFDARQTVAVCRIRHENFWPNVLELFIGFKLSDVFFLYLRCKVRFAHKSNTVYEITQVPLPMYVIKFLSLQNIERSYGKNFVDALNELTEKLLRQFDACLTVDDIQRGSKL